MDDFSKWKEVFIDPGVWDLVKSDQFKWHGKIDIPEFLDSLPDNHYFSWDYPGDMNLKYQDKFLIWTYSNAINYHLHSQYIVTVQSKFKNYFNFMYWFDKYNDLDIKSGIMGLGNMCRFAHLNDYLKHALDYAFSNCNHKRIHIYGLCLRAIPYAYKLSKKNKIKLSIDSTKWTRACSNALKTKYNGKVCCNSENRQEFLNEYKKRIEEVLRCQ
jgi:hypothetical protein